jgi:O-antigen ligase
MPQHALAGAARRLTAPRPGTALAALTHWHDARPRASFATARGWWWAALVAALFFWMSNPLVFVPTFYTDVGIARIWVMVVAALSLPWLRLPRVPWPWLLFVGLGLLSRFWTIDEFHTFVTNSVYLQVAAMAVVVAANCEPLVVSWGLGMGGVVVVVLSLHAHHLELPGASNTLIGGADFTGIGTNENILAYTLALALAAMWAAGRQRHRGLQLVRLLTMVVHAYGIYLAGSGTGYLTVIAVLVTALAIVEWPRLGALGHRVLLGVLAGAVVSVAFGLWLVVAVLDKQVSTLSGRVPFWRATIDVSLDEAPFLGSGWGAVWEHPWDPAAPNDVADEIYTRAGFPLSHGHNLFLDVLPELGLVGVAVALLMVAYAVREVRRCGLHEGAPDPVAGRLVLMVLVALLVSGITEPMLTVPLGWWSLTMVVTLARQRAGSRAVSAVGGRRARRGARVARPRR